MKKSSTGKLKPEQLCKLLLAAQVFRRRFFRDDERFDPVRVIEHCLPLLYPTLVVDIVESLEVDGYPADAAVTYDDGVLLEITQTTYQQANLCISDELFSPKTLRHAPAVFTLAHEIAHLLLHTAKFQRKLKQLARGVPGSGTSFQTNPKEEQEANVFAGGLLIPIDMVSVDAEAWMLQFKYRTSREVAQRIIAQKKLILET